MRAACFLAFCTGFLSLSMEILWIRLFAFSNHSMPQAFAFVLATFLVGIALGAYVGKLFCKSSRDLWAVSGLVLILSSVCDLTGPWLYANVVFSGHQLLVGGAIMMLTALLKSVVFPIAHHLGTPAFGVNLGQNVSRVYVSNILGATLGPLFTGIVLLALVTTQQSFVICAALTLLVAFYCLRDVLSRFALSVSALALSCQFALILSLSGHDLVAKVAIPGYGNIINMLENQYGIITIYADKHGDNIVAGGNAYDGSTNLDPVFNSNRINRVIIMSALVDHPTRVLMIGLSIGSWLKVVTTFPGVESIDVIEINPGYTKVIENYPAQMMALLDPRVHLYIDDGRRWLKAHPDNRYDMIVMNTTYHWRAYITNLLSQEFLKLLKKHMNPQAVLEYNSTGSPDVVKTAESVFKHAYLYENFVIAADFDWRKKLLTQEAVDKLSALMMDGRPLYPAGSQKLIAGYLSLPIVQLGYVEPLYNALGRQLEVITDRNVITEFKYGREL